MKKQTLKIISILILLILGALGLITEENFNFSYDSFLNSSSNSSSDSNYKDTIEIPENFYKVIKVIDGDTISIDFKGDKKTIRLIGIDTPEIVHPNLPVQCFGIEASNKAKELLENNIIRLEFDETQGEQDKYGRMLAYVFLEDGTNFNKYMIQNGYAYEYTYGEAYKYQKEFKFAQEEAKINKRGLWGNGVCGE